jgi:hypothetical protein
VLVALAAAAVLWFLNAHERVPVQEWVGPSGEARRNPYLAAERFALRMGLRARHVRTMPELDSLAADGVLLMPNRRQAIDPRRMRDLAGWVEGGGHLIAEAELPGVADPLLDVFGVQRTAAPPQAKPVAVEVPGGRTLNVTLHGPAALKAVERDVTWRAGSPDGAQLLSFTHGRGNFTAVSSLGFARNSAIATQDNAEFLWQLTELSPTTELRVYLPPERLSLWSFLTAHAAPVLMAAAALLVLWLWRIAPRFGPVAPDLPPARRRLLDHLRASGRYYWSAGRRERLVVAAREAALRRMARAQPDFAFAPAAERAARLSALAALPTEDAERFLGAEDSVRGADFVRLMHTSQRIHSALEKGNR